MLKRSGVLALFLALSACRAAPEPAPVKDPPPTLADVAYGPHERQALDFWRADTADPAPLLVFIHGGGFVAGSKDRVNQADVRTALARGVAFAAINYRYRTTVPLPEVLRDCARAVQFLRFRAADYHLDPTRVACYGGSAGAGTSVWLAVHDDLADPTSDDPVLRQSTRLTAAGAYNGQFTYDILQWTELFGVDVRQFHRDDPRQFYGMPADELETEHGRAVRADLDMRGLLTPDDAPLYLFCANPDEAITTVGILNHHPRHMIALKQRCDEQGVTAVLALPRANHPLETPAPPPLLEWVINRLTAGR